MTITTLSNQEFDEDVDRAKRVTKNGPVFINKGDEPVYVFLSIENYRQLTNERGSALSGISTASKPVAHSKPRMSIIDTLGMPPGIEDVDVEFPRLDIKLRPVDFD